MPLENLKCIRESNRKQAQESIMSNIIFKRTCTCTQLYLPSSILLTFYLKILVGGETDK